MKKKRIMQEGLLLLEDVINLGRKGEVVRARPGFAWNFLLPQKKAVVASKATIRLQEKLKAERAKQAIEDEKQARTVAIGIKGQLFITTVKTDTNGHLYGSVTASDIVKIFNKESDTLIDRRSVILPKPIKKVGVYTIKLSLKEGVLAEFKLKVRGEGEIEEVKPKVELVDEEAKEEAEETPQGEELPSDTEKSASLSKELEERTKNNEEKP